MLPARQRKCAHTKCDRLVHPDPSFGGFCCRRCHAACVAGRPPVHGDFCSNEVAATHLRRASGMPPKNPMVVRLAPGQYALLARSIAQSHNRGVWVELFNYRHWSEAVSFRLLLQACGHPCSNVIIYCHLLIECDTRKSRSYSTS